jgi:RimJ/RimL family protein N-acetyltransferase
MIIETARTRLRCLQETDREAFAALNADPEVSHDLGGPFGRAASDAKFDRYVRTFERHGVCRWAVESGDDTFLGYVGVMPAAADHPLGSHFDIGWRLARRYWGFGYATEAARAALADVFRRVGLDEVLAYTEADNHRSRRVIQRLGLRRDPSRDFMLASGRWRGLVWAAERGEHRGLS